MKKFYILIRKEIKELLTPQMILPIIVTMAIFAFIGNIAGNEAKKSQENRPLTVVNFDQSEAAKAVIETLKAANFKISEYDRSKTVKQAVEETRERKASAVVVIPEGFTTGILAGRQQEIEAYTIMSNFSLSGSQNSAILKSALEAINNYVSDQFIATRISDLKPEEIKTPIKVHDTVVVGER